MKNDDEGDTAGDMTEMTEITVREYRSEDVKAMNEIWNEVVEDGIAFPQEECLDETSGMEFFAGQTYCAVAENSRTCELLGLYILHPNNVGRCGHISNASYAVASRARGMHTNLAARHLYERLGFRQLGKIPGGFRMKNGEYEDICPYYIEV